ncbi:MAG TPA: phosphoserine aminotransferase, partial [Phycisphaerae bacterium]|nr:phosphoserine aminotransferase [Phycisphaerae bacterium]
MTIEKPARRPANPRFSTGPTAKRPGWSPEILKNALVGRAHRSKSAKARLKRAIDETRRILRVPTDYRIAIVPASDTGAMEMALWSLLGARGVDVLAWESFGHGWVADVIKQLRIADARAIEAPYGGLPDLRAVDFN